MKSNLQGVSLAVVLRWSMSLSLYCCAQCMSVLEQLSLAAQIPGQGQLSTSRACEPLYMADPCFSVDNLARQSENEIISPLFFKSSPCHLVQMRLLILRLFESSGETKLEALILVLLPEGAVKLHFPRQLSRTFPATSAMSSMLEVFWHFFLCFGLVQS